MVDKAALLLFSELAPGDLFQIAPEVRWANLLPTWTYRKADDVSATAEGFGPRGFFKPGTPVVRSADDAE